MSYKRERMKRTERIQFRVTPIEKEMIERLAEYRGIPLADLIRRFISLEVDKHLALTGNRHEN